MTDSIDIPARAASPDSATSQASGSPPLQLDPSTLALLDSFYNERDEAEKKFQELEEAAHARLLKAQAGEGAEDDDEPEKAMMSVDEFRALFGEDWQLSQFWYSTPFAISLARFIRSLCLDTTTRVAFLCCPTGYVGFQHTNPLPETKLLEYDRRFGLFAGKNFVPYDIDEPEDLPAELKGTVELAVCDPPFLNEITNKKLARTLSHILHPTKGRLVLLTSTSVEHLFPDIYGAAPLGPLYKSEIKVTHAGGIANNFGVWTSWKMKEGEKIPGFEEQ